MNDVISRQAVLKIIDGWYEQNRDTENIEDLIVLITYMDSVNPQEPKTGHWIKSRDCYGNNHFTCPFCEHDIATKNADTWEDNYCSNCGARMESEDKG